MHITIESSEEMIEKWRQRSWDKLNAVYGSRGGIEPSLQIHLREGKPHEEILKAAEELDADMIIMGSHGRTGLERSILGSVTGKVIRMADIPVLLIK
jgi:nucleotide-binding universal stress UspA family protein